MNLRQVVPSGFGVVFLLVLISTIVSDVTTNALENSRNLVAKSYQVKESLVELEKTLVDAETGQRGFIFSGKEEFLEPYNQAIYKIDDILENVEVIVSDSSTQVENLVQIRELANQKLEELKTTIDWKKVGREEELRELVLSGLGKQIMENIRAEIAVMKEFEDRQLEGRYELANQASILVKTFTWGSLAAILVVGLITVIAIDKIAIAPINKIVSSIASSTNEIAATMEEQERTVSQQVNSVNTTTTTMKELSSSSQQCSQQAQATVNAAQQALQVAKDGGISVAETLDGMTNLEQKVGEIAAQIMRLNEQTNQIGNISRMVRDLANQTNLLALNAAVEAVRAGENGKGFSVVAGEIRKLAEQSKVSAEKINSLVGEIQDSIASTTSVTEEGTKTANWGMKITEKTTIAFEGIADSVNNVVVNNQEIHLNTQEQATAVLQVLEAMNYLEIASQESREGVNQARLGIEQLKEVALQLKAIV